MTKYMPAYHEISIRMLTVEKGLFQIIVALVLFSQFGAFFT